jgi:hypothetical protein
VDQIKGTNPSFTSGVSLVTRSDFVPWSGFLPGKKGLHDHEPDQHQMVLMLPGPRHDTKQMDNKRGQIRDFDHRWQRYITG